LPTIAIIGAGPLGRWLAASAARAGFHVLLEDVMPSNLALAAPETSDASLSQVECVSSIEDAVRNADLAIDCVPDELESKLEILWLLDRMAPPRTVLATPTTRQSIADLAACTYRPHQCVAISLDPRDFANIPELGRVTLQTTPQTAPQAAAIVVSFWNQMGFEVTIDQIE
jgi:3-hydroxybutyryl-CoA dehydrogenase